MGFYRKSDEHLLFKFDQGRVVVLGIGAVLVVALVFLTGVLVGKSLWEATPEKFAADLNVKKYVPQVAAEKEAVVGKPVTAQRYTFYNEMNAKGESASLPTEIEKNGDVGMNASILLPGADTAAEESTDAEKMSELSKAELSRAGLSKTELSRDKPSQTVEANPDTVTTVVDRPVAPVAPVKVKAAPRASAAPVASTGKYTVQVASFAKPESAQAIAKKLAKQGFKANVVAADVKGRTWYRVYVGGFATRTEATEFYEKKLKPKGMDGFILSK